MQVRMFVLGLLAGGVSIGLPALFLASGNDADLPFDPIESHADTTDLAGETDPGRLHDEIAKLRSELERLRKAFDRSEVDTTEASTPSNGEAEAVAATLDSGLDPVLIADHAQAIALLVAELQEQLHVGLVRTRFASSPGELAMFVMQTWMAAGSPERAFRLLQQLRIEGLDSGTAHWIGMALKEKGDKTLARDAFLQGLRLNPTDWSVIQSLAEVDPDAALQEQTRLLAESGTVSDDATMQKAFLLLAAHRRDDALAVIDKMIGDDKMQDYLWDQLAQREPLAAVERLRKQLEGNAENPEMRLRLVTALRNSGDAAGARKELDTLLSQQPADPAAIQALGQLDRRAALSHLEAQVSTAPSGGTWWLYAEQLQAADRKDDAITAYWQAWKTEPNNGYQYRLLELAPERFAAPIAEQARATRDDEALGDVADVLWRQGRKDEARLFWEQASQFDPTDGEWTGKLAAVRAGRDPFR